MFKFLKDSYKDIGELKKAFRDLLMVNHPDKGGNEEDCKVLISEYESLITRMPKKSALEREQHKPESQRVYRPSDFYSYDKEFVDALMGLIGLKLANIGIEVCGWFIYASNVTKEEKDKVKALGYKWNSSKLLWYFPPSWWSAGKNHKPWDMNTIRQAYGSKVVNNEGQAQLS